jgi:hypothetical protein
VSLFNLHNRRYGRMARLYNNLDVFPLFQWSHAVIPC